jgi:hypothetical protein
MAFSRVIGVRDSVTGVLVENVGDDANNAVRCNMVTGTVTGSFSPSDVESPVSEHVSSAALAAGVSVDLDVSALPAASTGYLMAVLVSATVPCKWEIKSRDGAVEIVFDVIVTSIANPTFAWTTPDKRFNTLAYVGGDENFRVTATNLDQANAADVYATVYWDEVT